jgi:4-hydroxybenzoate polyprenyltransferase
LCLIEARPVVAVMFALRYLTAAMLAGGADRLQLVRVLAGAVVWEFVVLSSYILNGTMDVAEDRINGSRRPIASGRLPLAVARRAAGASAVIAVAGGLALGSAFGCLVVAFLSVGYLYSAPRCCAKRHAAACALAGVLLALLTYGAACAAARASSVSRACVIFCVMMALWTGIVGSIAKDIPDVVGDMAAGRRTIAVMLGETGARALACAAALAIGAACTAAAAVAAPLLLAPAVATLGGALLVAIVAARALSGGAPDRRRWPYRAFMVTQYAVHLCMLAILAWPALTLAR